MRGNLRATAEFCNARVPSLLVFHLDLLLGYGHRIEVNIIISKDVCRLLRPYIPNSLVQHEVKILLKILNDGDWSVASSTTFTVFERNRWFPISLNEMHQFVVNGECAAISEQLLNFATRELTSLYSISISLAMGTV